MVKKIMDMNVMRVVLAIVLIALYFLPYNVIAHLKNTWVRVVVMLLIVGVCLYDPIISLLLAIAFVAILQRVQDKKDNFMAPTSAPTWGRLHIHPRDDRYFTRAEVGLINNKFNSRPKRHHNNNFKGQQAKGANNFQKLQIVDSF